MAPVDQILLPDVLVTCDDPGFLAHGVITEAAMKYMNQFVFDLDSHTPLFKLVMFDSYTLSVVFDHTLYDGLVGNYFHEELVEFLAQNQNGDVLAPLFNYANDICLLKSSLPPPIDDFLPSWDIDYADNDPNFYDKLTPPELSKFPGRFRNAQGLSKAFKLIKIPPSQLKVVLAACKAHGVTLTSYLAIVFVHSFVLVFPDTFTLNRIAMNLRRFMTKENAPAHYTHFFYTPNYKIMGNLPHLGLANNLPPLLEFSWDHVTEFNTNLVKSTANKHVLNLLKPFRDSYVPGNNSAFFDSKLGQAKPETTKISNLGFIKTPEINGWTISDMIFSQDMSAITSDFMVNVVSTARGGLNVVVSYFDHSFGDVEMENFDEVLGDFGENLVTYAQA